MGTIINNLQRIRLLLDEPSRPESHILFELLENRIQHHLTALSNSSAHWSVYNFPLTVSAGQEDYLITAPNFGKPFWVYSEDDTDPVRPRSEVPFCLLQNISQFYQGPRQIMSVANNVPTVSVIAFYKQYDAVYARVAPVPGGTQQYRIWYETLPVAPETFGDMPGLSAFHHLIRVETALSAIPACVWGDVKVDAENEQKAQAWIRKTTALSLARTGERTDFKNQFETYLGTLMQAGIEGRDPFGEGYDIDWAAGIGTFGPNSW